GARAGGGAGAAPRARPPAPPRPRPRRRPRPPAAPIRNPPRVQRRREGATVRRPADRCRPRQRPAAGDERAEAGRVALPVQEPAAAAVALLLPRRRVLGPPRARDPRQRGGERRRRGDRIPERPMAVVVRARGSGRPRGGLPPPARRPLPLSAGGRGRGGRAELPPAVLRWERPSRPAARADGQLLAAHADERRVPERRHAAPRRRPPRE